MTLPDDSAQHSIPTSDTPANAPPSKSSKVSSEPLIDHIENLDRDSTESNEADLQIETDTQVNDQTVEITEETDDVEADDIEAETMVAQNPESTIILESVSPDVVIATLETPESNEQVVTEASEPPEVASQTDSNPTDTAQVDNHLDYIADENAEITISAEGDVDEVTESIITLSVDSTDVDNPEQQRVETKEHFSIDKPTTELSDQSQNEQDATYCEQTANKQTLFPNQESTDKESTNTETETVNEETTKTAGVLEAQNNEDEKDKSNDEIHEEEEKVKEVKEAKLESYKQFVAEQFSKQKIDYPEVRVKIEANALPTRMYFVMNILSAIIASYGLVTNSAAVVIGAMLVAMMLGPITGVALAVIDNRIPLLRKSLFTVAAGVFLVIFVGFIIGLLHNEQPLTAEILSRTQPTSMDLMIALAGGTAGAYAMVSPHLSVAVVGVAVATALVPPLAASGILFANGELTLGFGAALLALTNIIAIQFTNAMVLWILGFRRLIDDDYKTSTYLTFLRRNAIALVLLGILGTYLTINLQTNAKQQVFESSVKSAINDHFIEKGNVLTNTQFTKGNGNQIVRAVIRGETTPDSNDVNQIEAIVTKDIAENYPNYLPIKLQLRYIPVQVIESNPIIRDKLDETDAAILTN